MTVFAAGFNAWHQLDFTPLPEKTEPHDILSFTKVLEHDLVDCIRARLSYTLVRAGNNILTAGTGYNSGLNDVEFKSLCQVAQASNGVILVVEEGNLENVPSEVAWTLTQSSQKVLVTYASASDFESRNPRAAWPCKSPVKEIAAFDAGFVILHEDGTVATLGDPRYPDCLGREVGPESPADVPGIVPDLVTLGDPIKHVTAGGYALAALTESGSIYIWGKSSQTSHRSCQVFTDLVSMPNYCEIDDGKDVQDIALGESHAIALTTDGTVYVVGGNSNGQLGLGTSANVDNGVESWTPVELDIGEDTAIAVAAGPRTSFIVTQAEQS